MKSEADASSAEEEAGKKKEGDAYWRRQKKEREEEAAAGVPSETELRRGSRQSAVCQQVSAKRVSVDQPSIGSKQGGDGKRSGNGERDLKTPVAVQRGGKRAGLASLATATDPERGARMATRQPLD